MARPSELIDQRLEPFSQGDPVIASWLRATIGRIMERDGFTDVEILDVPEDDIRHVADWFVAARLAGVSWTAKVGANGVPPKLMKFGSIEAIVREADRATVVLSQKGKDVVLLKGDEELVERLEGDAVVVRLLTPAALDREGAAMGHCIGGGSYDRSLKEGGLYLSVRDRRNRPHVTMQVVAGELRQFQGKQNKAPNSRWAVVALPYVLRQGWSLEGVDLSRMGLAPLSTGEVVPVTRIPPGSSVLGNMAISGNETARSLPRDMKVQGNLHIDGDGVQLPDGLVVGGHLCSEAAVGLQIGSGTRVGSLSCGKQSWALRERNGWVDPVPDPTVCVLPDDLIVEGDVWLSGPIDWRLPEGFSVRGSLDVSGTATASLPEGLRVRGDLRAAGCPILRLPDRFEVGGSIDVSQTGVAWLPDGLVVDGSLRLSAVALDRSREDVAFFARDGVEVRFLPTGLRVGGDLFLGGPVEWRLPPELIVGGKLDVTGTRTSILPEGLNVGGDLVAGGCPIECLPARFHVGGSMDLSESEIARLPDGMKVRGSLVLRKTRVESLPDGLEVERDLDLSEAFVGRFGRGTVVGRDLIARGMGGVEELSALSVGRHLDLPGSSLVSIQAMSVAGDLHIAGSRIRRIPDGASVGRNVDARGSAVSSVGRNVTVGGHLDLSGCPLTEIPPCLEVGGSLDLSDGALVELPAGLQVGGSLDVSGSRIRELPPDLRVGGHLRAMDLGLRSLPDGLRVEGHLYLTGSTIGEAPDSIAPGTSFLLDDGWYVKSESVPSPRRGIRKLAFRLARWFPW